jgi:hypothetical protein
MILCAYLCLSKVSQIPFAVLRDCSRVALVRPKIQKCSAMNFDGRTIPPLQWQGQASLHSFSKEVSQIPRRFAPGIVPNSL